jgi:DNA repair protein RadC
VNGSEEPHYLGHRSRLRQRFERSGFDGFASHEVVELLLTLAIPRRDVKQPAKALLVRFGSLRGILDAPSDQLREVAGLGEVAPVALRVIREAAMLYLQQAAEVRAELSDLGAVESMWRSRLGGLRDEVFEVALVDSALRLLPDGVCRVEEGTVDRAAVYPRKVMELALRRGAAGLLLAHNHPSGSVVPSEQDKTVTRAIALAASPLGIEVHDHLVVSADEVFSFRKEGLL